MRGCGRIQDDDACAAPTMVIDCECVRQTLMGWCSVLSDTNSIRLVCSGREERSGVALDGGRIVKLSSLSGVHAPFFRYWGTSGSSDIKRGDRRSNRRMERCICHAQFQRHALSWREGCRGTAPICLLRCVLFE